jgi:hypothetical protein
MWNKKMAKAVLAESVMPHNTNKANTPNVMMTNKLAEPAQRRQQQPPQPQPQQQKEAEGGRGDEIDEIEDKIEGRAW